MSYLFSDFILHVIACRYATHARIKGGWSNEVGPIAFSDDFTM